MKKITAFSLLEFCQETQAAIVEGYRFDFSQNDTCPSMFGTIFECTMVNDSDVEMNKQVQAKSSSKTKRK